MYFVSPKEREKYFLRLLLLHVRGAKSFEDIKTFNNITYSTYLEAAIARNLIQTDKEWERCLNEACQNQFPLALCNLFALICTQNNPINARELYDNFKDHFYYPRMDKATGENWALKKIEETLMLYGMTLEHFQLPSYHDIDVENNFFQDRISTNDNNVTDQELSNSIKTLTSRQKNIFDKVIHALKNINNPKYFFIDGPGGSGKSYLLNIIIDYMILNNITIVPVAWTGIAATLLKGGKTVHTTFKLNLDIEETSTSNIKPNSNDGRFLMNAQVLIWDEITMASKAAFELVDKLFKDLKDNNKPFGNIIVILSGDFRQTLPIIRHGNRVQIIENLVKNSYLQPYFETIKLFDNKRLNNTDQSFKQWLLDIGDGTFKNQLEEDLEITEIPSELQYNDDIISGIFGNNMIATEDNSVNNKAILTTNNSDVLEINEKILEKLEGNTIDYYSVDSAVDDDQTDLETALPIEFLNSLTPNGLPPHKLSLKVGAITYIVRNLNANCGLVNGQRLKIIQLGEFSITAKILNGSYADTITILPRITLSPHKLEMPFSMYRRQFPLRLAYAITINRSQGQTYNDVGIILFAPVFSHGQLYVALSRCTNKQNIKVVLKHEKINVTTKKKITM